VSKFIIYTAKSFSKSFDNAGKILIGRKSLNDVGDVTLGMGITFAVFHIFGNSPIRIDSLIVVYLTSSCVIWTFFGMSGPV
jgi:hypothetical protein